MRIGVVGDIHRHWGDEDLAYFDGAGLDHVLFVGDLGGYALKGAVVVAESIARMTTPSLVVPGNHDGANLGQLVGEVVGSRVLVRGFSPGHGRRRDRLASALGGVPLGGYSSHTLGDSTLICGRPHSMGGPSLSFTPLMRARFGVSTLDESAARLRALVDAAPTSDLVFLSHNGPTGLGDRRDAIWGCDFKATEGDFGDPDLRAAVDHARESGRRVVAVVAGHMHRTLRGGGRRRWTVQEQETLMINAAEVPRVRQGRRHHLRLTIEDGVASAEDVWIDAAGREMD
jgi:uncharacterized protein (TIGR04168 family)